MADLEQTNKLLSLGRRRSNATAVELDVARRKFWDAVDSYADDLMLVGGGGSRADGETLRLRIEREAEIVRLKAENAGLNLIKTAQQREIDALRRNPQSSDQEFEELLQENGRLRQDCDRLREQLRMQGERGIGNPIPPVPPVPRRY